MHNVTIHLQSARRRAMNIEHLASEDVQARDMRHLITPARTGGKIGQNHRRKHPLPAWAQMAIAAACMGGVAIALALFTAATTR